jgi:hypothetical protein
MPTKRKQPKSNKNWVQLAQHFVSQWPEVLEGIELTRMPITYVDAVSVILKNNVTIVIDVKASLKKMTREQTAAMLKSYINKNYANIKTVDLKFNVTQLKEDMENKTKAVLSKTFNR